MKKWYPLLVALLGIVVGALLVLSLQTMGRGRKLAVTEGGWQKLNLILQTLDRNYVDSIDHAKVTQEAVVAALSALDPHSIYLPPADLEESETDLAGQFDGIGIQFNVPNDTAIVIAVIPGGPSEKIGLRVGDRLLKVDSTVIAGVKFPQDSMVRRMRGKAGTKVTVTVERDSEAIPFEITRGKIPVHSVDAAFMVRDTVGYLRLSKFSRTTFEEVYASCEKLRSEGMKYLVFDLRGNNGGFLDQALNVANLFLPKDSLIVYMEGRRRSREEYRANGKGTMQDVKLALLIDDGSASSAEILSGAIQDNHRGKIFGRRSFGKGLVQEPVFFSDGSGVRITVARFYTPSGRCIQKPYSKDYNYEVLKRYNTGELLQADSMKAEMGGIIPDVFVALDTTSASQFYIACNRKACTMRYAASFFDAHKDTLSSIDDFDTLTRYLDGAGLERGFLNYVLRTDGLKPSGEAEWNSEKSYLLTQLRALISRYSRLGDNAFYHLYLETDDTFAKAIENQ